MENNIKLVDELNILSRQGMILREIPEVISKNLNPKFTLREYQKEAFGRFEFYLNHYQGKKDPTHLLFNMATGSGKTLLMAIDILYLYSLGYRNFIFFVNSTNIIKKTQSNFLDKSATKYLFSDKIVIEDKEIRIEEVDNFEGANPDNINILFTTIQGMHTRLNTPQENSITYEDFKEMKIVFLSDEAHHINALTKSKLDKEEQTEKNNWEYTVSKIFNSNKSNILLEYTATIELSHQAISKKYADKIIYQYNLASFREDGYSKDVKLLQSDWEVKERALQAVILSQYRRKIADKYKIHLKPVILFKSKQIKESEEFELIFNELIDNLTADKVKEIESHSSGIIQQAFGFFAANNISIDNLIRELKNDFSKDKCLIINSKADSESKQLRVNTLEDYNNEIRVIFTTNMLNEGWDVLNLFDIVRLYATRDAKNNISGSTTISEAQLIGRGARYYPFTTETGQVKDKRKFDEDITNELRLLEELHYHSLTDSRYISELRNELINIGITPSNRKEMTVSIKEEIKKSSFWENGLIFINKPKLKDYSEVKKLDDVIKSTLFKYKLKIGESFESGIFDEDQEIVRESYKKKTLRLNSFEPNILRKALDKVEFYKFDNLNHYFPGLKSVREFISNDEYSGLIEVDVYAKNGKLANLNNQDKFNIALSVYKELSQKILTANKDYEGTKEFFGYEIKTIAKNKTLEILEGGKDKEFGIAMSETHQSDLNLDLSNQDWYVYDENYGTSEEKYFIQFIYQAIDDLKKKYEDIYLLRNENLFKIYRFSDGSAMEPDFVLFLKSKGGKALSYQLFIEPKGNRGLVEDKWKEDFLKEIETEYRIETLFEKDNYKLIGLPFYNEQNTRRDFSEVFSDKLGV